MQLENNFNNIQDLCYLSSEQDLVTDLVLTMLGKKIGEGQTRTVYDYNLAPNLGIKIETGNTLHNPSEYLVWDDVKYLSGELAWVKDWFAPIKWISPNGKLLLMEKTLPMYGKLRPDKVPDFFTDIKFENFPWIGKKFVCHDYGFLCRRLLYTKKFRKASW